MSAAPPIQPPAYQPYRWASVDFTIGLRPVRKSEWIQFSPHHADNMRAKRSRLGAQCDRYYRTLPESLHAQRELRDLVVAHLVTDHADRYALSGATLTSRHESRAWRLDDPQTEPLRQLSDVTEEDFMLLEERDGVMRITASSNAYSSSGRLVSAVGETVHWAHIPVPTLSDKLGVRIDRVLSSVHEDTPCERFNWQVTPLATLFFPDDPHRANANAMHAVRDALYREPAVRHLQSGPARGGISKTSAQKIATARIQLDSYCCGTGRAVDGRPPEMDALSDALLGTETRGLSTVGRTAAINTYNRAFGDQIGKITIATEHTVTFTSGRAPIPITVLNDATYPVTVVMTLASDEFTFPNGNTRTLTLNRPTTSVRVVAQARSSGGRLPIDVTLHTPDGQLLLARTELTVHSTAISFVGVALTVLAGIVLLVWWARTWRRSRRARPRAH